ncbi:hypothetical protein GCM10023259_033880 [Thermocatellispora tengchongensis]
MLMQRMLMLRMLMLRMLMLRMLMLRMLMLRMLMQRMLMQRMLMQRMLTQHKPIRRRLTQRPPPHGRHPHIVHAHMATLTDRRHTVGMPSTAAAAAQRSHAPRRAPAAAHRAEPPQTTHALLAAGDLPAGGPWRAARWPVAGRSPRRVGPNAATTGGTISGGRGAARPLWGTSRPRGARPHWVGCPWRALYRTVGRLLRAGRLLWALRLSQVTHRRRVTRAL